MEDAASASLDTWGEGGGEPRGKTRRKTGEKGNSALTEAYFRNNRCKRVPLGGKGGKRICCGGKILESYEYQDGGLQRGHRCLQRESYDRRKGGKKESLTKGRMETGEPRRRAVQSKKGRIGMW